LQECVEGLDVVKACINLESKDIRFRLNRACCVDFAWASRGCYCGVHFHKDNPWDYVPGQYLMERAGGISYNAPGMHITAANKECLEILKNIVTKGTPYLEASEKSSKR